MNFMNFRDDECLVFFTKGQVQRMRESLFESRNALINSNTCSGNNPIPDDPLKIARIATLDDRLVLSLNTLINQDYTLEAFDMAGRKIVSLASKPTHIYELPFASFPSGVYILSLQLGNSQWVRKVYIE